MKNKDFVRFFLHTFRKRNKQAMKDMGNHHHANPWIGLRRKLKSKTPIVVNENM